MTLNKNTNTKLSWCLGLPLDINVMIESVDICTPEIDSTFDSVPHRGPSLLNYATYTLHITSLPWDTLFKLCSLTHRKCHWKGTAYFYHLLQLMYHNSTISQSSSFIYSETTSNTTHVSFYDYIQEKQTIDQLIHKRFSDFDKLYRHLVMKYPSLPLLPEKTFSRTLNPTYLNERKVALNQFLQCLINRRDIMSDPYVITFFHCDQYLGFLYHHLLPYIYMSLDPINEQSSFMSLSLLYRYSITLPSQLHSENTISFLGGSKHRSISDIGTFYLEPFIVLEVQEAFFGISSVVWDSELGLLILGSADFSFFSRLDSLLTRVRLPWESSSFPIPTGRVSFWKYHQTETNSNCTQHTNRSTIDPIHMDESPFYFHQRCQHIHSNLTTCNIGTSTTVSNHPTHVSYHIPKTIQTPPQFDLLYFLDVPSQIKTFHYSPTCGHLFVGLHSGDIEYFSIQTHGSNNSLQNSLQSRCKNESLNILIPPPITTLNVKRAHDDNSLPSKHIPKDTIPCQTSSCYLAISSKYNQFVYNHSENKTMDNHSVEDNVVVLSSRLKPSLNQLSTTFKRTSQSQFQTLHNSNNNESNPITNVSSLSSSLTSHIPESGYKDQEKASLFDDFHITILRQSASSLGYLLPHHADTISSIAFDTERHVIFTASFDRSLKVFDMTKRRYYSETHCPSGISCMLYLPQYHDILVIGCTNGSLYIYNTNNLHQLVLCSIHYDITECPNDNYHTLIINDSFISHLSNSEYLSFIPTTKPIVPLFNTHDKQCVTCIIEANRDNVRNHLNTASSDDNNTMTNFLKLDQSQLVDITIIIGLSNGDICIWDIQLNFILNACTLKLHHRLSVAPFGAKVTAISFMPSENWLAIGSSIGTITILECDAYEFLYTYKAHSGSVEVVQWIHSIGTLLSAGMDRLVRWWRLKIAHVCPNNTDPLHDHYLDHKNKDDLLLLFHGRADGQPKNTITCEKKTQPDSLSDHIKDPLLGKLLQEDSGLLYNNGEKRRSINILTQLG